MEFYLNLTFNLGDNMKFIASKEKYTGLSKPLALVLEEVYNKRPLLEFEVTSTIPTDDATRVARSVNVWQHGQRLGSIDAHHRKYSPKNSTSETVYAVESPLIDKQRGRRNTKFCKSAPTAAKVVIDVFAKQPLRALGADLANQLERKTEYLKSNATMIFVDNIRKSSIIDMATYFVESYLGNNPILPASISKNVNDDTLKKYDNYKIASSVCKHMENKNAFGISYMKDGTLLVVDLANHETTSKVATTYEMPQFMQEKFTMLKLLDRNQFAQDIGVRIETSDGEDAYLIVKGETVVQ